MPVAVKKRSRFFNMEEVLRNLGSIPPSRVRMDPAPGTATLRDLIRLWKAEGKMCELVDGTLVEKPMAFDESTLATEIASILLAFVKKFDLGKVSGEQGMMRLMPRLARAPDIGFVSWAQIPDRSTRRAPVPEIHPDLAVEILSKGNTRKEMARKRREYFKAGTRLVWMVNPRIRTVDVYTEPDTFETLTEADILTGGDVLPGFKVPVREIFAGYPSKPPSEKKED